MNSYMKEEQNRETNKNESIKNESIKKDKDDLPLVDPVNSFIGFIDIIKCLFK